MNRATWLLSMLALAACGGEFHTPAQDATVGLSARSDTRDDDNTTLTVSRMRLVVGSVQLVSTDGSIDKLDGPFLLDPKLDGSWTEIAEQAVGHGTYRTVSLALRPLSPDVPAEVTLAHDQGFDDLLQANASMAFEGTYGPQGQPANFEVKVAGAATQTVSIDDGFEVKLGADANVTLSTRLDDWFARDALGHPTDPRNVDPDDTLSAFTSHLRADADDDRNGSPDH